MRCLLLSLALSRLSKLASDLVLKAKDHLWALRSLLILLSQERVLRLRLVLTLHLVNELVLDLI